MATYQKKATSGKKSKAASEIEKGSTTAEVFNTLDAGASKTEAWVAANQKYILVFIGAVVLGVLGYMGYNEFIQKPKSMEAANEISLAQSYFDQAINGTAKDSLFTLALNGGGGKYGFLDIADKYSGTKTANLAHYYAGISYLNLKDYPNAIKHLEKFSSDDMILSSLALGSIGDAFSELGQYEDALSYYEKAFSKNENELSTPLYLYKAGLVALELNKPAQAKEYFERIKKDFPASLQANQVDVLIGQAKQAE